MSDLSEYEKKRLERILRNRAQLAALGVESAAAAVNRATTQQKAATAAANPVKKRVANERVIQREAPTRSSKRLRGSVPDYTGERIDGMIETAERLASADASESEEVAVDYNEMPLEPNHLDDHEFEVYTILRAWRLERKRELEIEPYKIFQNRTLCEVVRRLRNNPEWAMGQDKENRGLELLESWGIGASKVGGCRYSEEGFAHELQRVLSQDEIRTKLEESRVSAADKSDTGGANAVNAVDGVESGADEQQPRADDIPEQVNADDSLEVERTNTKDHSKLGDGSEVKLESGRDDMNPTSKSDLLQTTLSFTPEAK